MISRRLLLLTTLPLLLPTGVWAEDAKYFYWDHPGGDPFDRERRKPAGPAIRALLAGTITPDDVVDELVAQAARSPGNPDSLPDNGAYFFTRMNSGSGIKRNVWIRDASSPAWQAVPHEMDTYYVLRPGRVYCLIRLRVCGNWALQVLEGGRCVEDEVLCKPCDN